MLVSDIVRKNAQTFPSADALVVPGGPTRTWADLDRRTNQIANAFAALGLSKGDRVAMFAPNCPEYLEFFFGCAKSGVIGAALNIRLAASELAAYLGYVEPKAVLVHAALAEEAAAWLAEGVPVLTIGFGGDHAFDFDFETIIGAAASTDPQVEVLDSDIYQLAASSGTTGMPKGSAMTHRNAISAMLNWASEVPIPERSTGLQCIPYFFNPGGPASLHPVLLKGGRMVIPEAFTPLGFIDLVETYRVTHTIVVPTMLQMILMAQATENRDLSSLTGIITGGSPLSAALLAKGREVIGDVFYPIYGMAEMYACAMILRPENQFTEGTEQQRRQLGSLGRPMVLTQVRVVGNDGQDVPRDGTTPGEIWLSGDAVSPGYFNMPEATEDSRQDGWFKSGDVGVIDAEGFVTIVDRLKDIIITGGINVSSVEVENAITRHPSVMQAAVIGVPHETWGEAIHAVVVRKPDGPPVVAEDLIEFVGDQVASYKKPRTIEFVDELPLSGTGKVLKRVLRETRTKSAKPSA
ncbi:class I adenylate-forming enzyme family protein [Sphaerimonospora sp. CA-214678]|uniref:class I adenylate-forming enzyme family protein n=1 Tax=Sphaerimonospora sp. CA-214678 TaxID=3240029 RepID=UPI003D8A6FCE